jgi:hypothetical protein
MFISSPNVFGTDASANWSISSILTAITNNMAVRDLKSYQWCMIKNCAHTTSGCSMEHVSSCFDYKGSQWNKLRECCTKVNILHITVTYLIVTINRNVRKQEPEIETDRSSKMRQNPRVDRYGPGIGMPRSGGSGFCPGRELDGTIFGFTPGLLAGYPDPLPTLAVGYVCLFILTIKAANT